MITSILHSKSDKIRFAYISTFFAFISGLIAFSIPIALDHIYFFISAPLATYLPSYWFWKTNIKSEKDYKPLNIILLGLGLTVTVHYFNFVILGIGNILCFYLFGKCTNYAGNVDSILGTLTYISFLRTFISLYYWGLFTLILFIISGLYVARTSKKNKHQSRRKNILITNGIEKHNEIFQSEREMNNGV